MNDSLNSLTNPPFLSITPLGGLEQIGSNMSLLEIEGHRILLDVGILFPATSFLNVNCLIPNYEALFDATPPNSIFITHAHEDHIGALSFFIKKFPGITVYFSEFVEQYYLKRSEFKHLHFKRELITATIPIKITSEIECTFLEFDHSIPQTHGLLWNFKTHQFAWLYISDFKLNPEETSLTRKAIQTSLPLFQKSKYSLVMADSTNITSKNTTKSEQSLRPSFQKYFKNNKRIFITFFASNIERATLLAEEAKKLGKKIVPVGRSMEKLTDFLKIPVFSPSQVSPDDSVIFFVSGCQADYKSALVRLAKNEHKEIKLKTGDLFLFSSKAIPGNEKALSHCYNMLTELGVDIKTAQDDFLHVSGHAYQEDLRYLYQTLKPTWAIPIHGELLFLKRHADFIEQEFSSLPIKPLFLKNFKKIEFFKENSGPEITPKISQASLEEEQRPLAFLQSGTFLSSSSLAQRAKMASLGVVITIIAPQKRNSPVHCELIGLPYVSVQDVQKYKKTILSLYKGLSKTHKKKDLSEEVRVKTRQFFDKLFGERPLSFVFIVD